MGNRAKVLCLESDMHTRSFVIKAKKNGRAVNRNRVVSDIGAARAFRGNGHFITWSFLSEQTVETLPAANSTQERP